MSASVEILLEQIKEAEVAIEMARKLGDDVACNSLQNKLKLLYAQFSLTSSALTEGKSVLKG